MIVQFYWLHVYCTYFFIHFILLLFRNLHTFYTNYKHSNTTNSRISNQVYSNIDNINVIVVSTFCCCNVFIINRLWVVIWYNGCDRIYASTQWTLTSSSFKLQKTATEIRSNINLFFVYSFISRSHCELLNISTRKISLI